MNINEASPEAEAETSFQHVGACRNHSKCGYRAGWLVKRRVQGVLREISDLDSFDTHVIGSSGTVNKLSTMACPSCTKRHWVEVPSRLDDDSGCSLDVSKVASTPSHQSPSPAKAGVGMLPDENEVDQSVRAMDVDSEEQGGGARAPIAVSTGGDGDREASGSLALCPVQPGAPMDQKRFEIRTKHDSKVNISLLSAEEAHQRLRNTAAYNKKRDAEQRIKEKEIRALTMEVEELRKKLKQAEARAVISEEDQEMLDGCREIDEAFKPGSAARVVLALQGGAKNMGAPPGRSNAPGFSGMFAKMIDCAARNSLVETINCFRYPKDVMNFFGRASLAASAGSAIDVLRGTGGIGTGKRALETVQTPLNLHCVPSKETVYAQNKKNFHHDWSYNGVYGTSEEAADLAIKLVKLGCSAAMVYDEMDAKPENTYDGCHKQRFGGSDANKWNDGSALVMVGDRSREHGKKRKGVNAREHGRKYVAVRKHHAILET